jgi:DNA-binding NarL/FixJ family response regulator
MPSPRGVTVTLEAADARQLVDSICDDPPDVAIIDIRMPPTLTDEGLAAAAIEKDCPAVGILLPSTYKVPSYAIRLLEIRTQGVGYLLKDRVDDLDQFIDALERVADGGSVIDHSVVSSMVTQHVARSPLHSLSDREKAVLQLLAEGSHEPRHRRNADGERAHRRGARRPRLQQAQSRQRRRRQPPRARHPDLAARHDGAVTEVPRIQWRL